MKEDGYTFAVFTSYHLDIIFKKILDVFEPRVELTIPSVWVGTILFAKKLHQRLI